jgi:hypothetical protein
MRFADRGAAVFLNVLVIQAALSHHDRAALRAVHLEAGNVVSVGHPGVAFQADATTLFSLLSRLMTIHGNPLSTNGIDRWVC